MIQKHLQTLVLVTVDHTDSFSTNDVIELIGERLLNADWTPNGVTIGPVKTDASINLNQITKEEMMRRMEAACTDASGWHQGSGTHADNCSALMEHFLELNHPEVALLWLEAAEAEALHLRSIGGYWLGHRQWKQSISGKATARAKVASRKVEPGFDAVGWGV